MVMYALINKEVIPYVCAGKRVTVEYLHNSTKFKIDKLNQWLDATDKSLPTILQAKKLAKCLHIPFAGLYMNVEDINIKKIPTIKNYRTFDRSLSIDDSGFNIAICDVLQERDYLIEESAEQGILLPDFSTPSCGTDNPADWAKAIRVFYSISTDDQYKCKSPRQFYLYLREKIELKGAFVQCFTDVPIDVVRGFSIYEKKLPIIGINDNDRSPAKSFSLIHELVHLIKRESSACNVMYNAMPSQTEEVFCNAVAGEVLVPKTELIAVLKKYGYKKPFSTDDIRLISKKFAVSKEVIIRRLLDCEKITSIEYKSYADEFRRILEREREKQRLERMMGLKTKYHTNVSRDAIDRTSPAICKTLLRGYSEEIYSKRDIAQHLGIAQKHIDQFLREVSRWNN